MESDSMYLCHKCGKVFYKLSTLESHSRWKHMEKTNEFMCDQCGRTFQKKYNLIKHLESAVHEISESVKCALCNFKALNRKLMCEHYHNIHCVLLKESTVYFKTVDEFFQWKSEFESKTKSRFVKMSSSRRRKNGFIRCTYFCHRDGNFVPKGRNLRHMKLKGSNKINAHCPAKMEVEIGERIVIVSYIDTHLGHDLDISRISLDPAEKALIAKKLSMKVPFEEILDEINCSPDGTFRRVNLITRKDLWNIVDTFKINPKTVVYSRNRLRRKRKNDFLKREPLKNEVYLKFFTDNSNNDLNCSKLAHSMEQEDDTFTGGEVISVKQESDNNVIFCPVFLKAENDQYIEQYTVVPDENNEGGGTCLIINANGELESLSGHKIIYTNEGNVQICESLEMEESKIFVDDPSGISHLPNSNEETATLVTNEEENVSLGVEVEGTETISGNQILNTDNSQKETSLTASFGTDNTENSSFIKSSDEIEEMTEVEPDNMLHTLQYIKNESNQDLIDQTMLIPVEEMPLEGDNAEYEVTIANYEGEDINEYVIISTEDESLNDCGVNTIEHSTHLDLNSELPVEMVVLKDEGSSNQGTVKEETVDEFGLYEEHVSLGEEEPKWDVKRKEALNKLLNVHNMISNEKQLNIFSKNISSLENVLKAFSKGDDHELENCGQES